MAQEEEPTNKETQNQKPKSTSDVEKYKVHAIVAYIGILWLIPLLTAKESKFAMYHANQGLVLFIAEVAIWLVVSFIVPFLWGLFFLIPLLWLATVALAIMGIINAANGDMKPLPVIGSIEILK